MVGDETISSRNRIGVLRKARWSAKGSSSSKDNSVRLTIKHGRGIHTLAELHDYAVSRGHLFLIIENCFDLRPTREFGIQSQTASRVSGSP